MTLRTRSHERPVADQLVANANSTAIGAQVSYALADTAAIAAVVLFFIDTLAYKLMVDWLPYIWGKL